jgi:hypothetical protein
MHGMSEEVHWNAIVEHFLTNENTLLLPSPHFNGKAPNYQTYCERFCRQLWWYTSQW